MEDHLRKFHSQFDIHKSVPVITKPPILYRYEKTKWIDEFFDTGLLKISTFRNYAKNPDNKLGDKFEGSPYLVNNLPENRQEIAILDVGDKSYSFAASTVLSESLFTEFSRDSVFQIFDPINFMIEIEKVLDNVASIYHGNCIYIRDGILYNQSSSPKADFLVYEGYFLKRIKYINQSEYRIIWITSKSSDNDLYIKVPEARRFCNRVKQTDFNDTPE